MQHTFSESFQHGDLKVIDCRDCAFKHLWPLPTEAEIKETYEKKFGGEVRSYFRQRKAEDVEHWQRVFARREADYADLLPGLENPRILDVGSGVGDFPAYFRERGWDAWGVEPSRAFHEDLRQRQISIIPSMIEDITEDEWRRIGEFDVINMSMFLEHVLDPQAVVHQVVRALKPGGILSVECPNDFNPMQMAAVQSNKLQMWWINRLHINYFDFESLENLCRAEGCEPVQRSTQFPLESFLLFGDNYVGDDALGRQVHKKRMRFEKSLVDSGQAVILASMYQALAATGVGRQAIVYTRKSHAEQA
ncbi:class I SAM-dependent methyltransferase [Hahella ganghwensis]|uniref:class I SAM-dependent methyltransferase n=1 Tax=Hahella ganghwensis TaxID=286420 RepID=UPI00035FAFA5|nr:class I SAM-dependent methyltransferase [Hahella ganghwensis]